MSSHCGKHTLEYIRGICAAIGWLWDCNDCLAPYRGRVFVHQYEDHDEPPIQILDFGAQKIMRRDPRQVLDHDMYESNECNTRHIVL